jgi:uncharacterized protein (TIGR02569 family)
MAQPDDGPAGPSDQILEAFDADGRPEQLPGGAQPTWRVGEIVLKRADIPDEQLRWQADLHQRLRHHAGFRVPQSIAARNGQLLVDRWCAMTYLPGRHEAGRWRDIMAVADVFHDALADEPAPSFLADRDDPWAIGDRVAWGEQPTEDLPSTKHLDRLLPLLEPIAERSQVIHGDLTGNVLFAEHLPPAIVDLSPYHRPKGFASAVVVADALVWEGAGDDLAHSNADRDFAQYLLRALIYRIVTDRLFRRDEPLRPDDEDPYAPAVELAATLAGA